MTEEKKEREREARKERGKSECKKTRFHFNPV